MLFRGEPMNSVLPPQLIKCGAPSGNQESVGGNTLIGCEYICKPNYKQRAMADLRLLGPYTVSPRFSRWWVGVPCFANLESERPGGQKIAVLAPL